MIYTGYFSLLSSHTLTVGRTQYTVHRHSQERSHRLRNLLKLPEICMCKYKICGFSVSEINTLVKGKESCSKILNWIPCYKNDNDHGHMIENHGFQDKCCQLLSWPWEVWYLPWGLHPQNGNILTSDNQIKKSQKQNYNEE